MMKRKSPYPYLLSVAIGLDQFANAIAKGDPDETISTRLGRRRVNLAIKKGLVNEADLCDPSGAFIPFKRVRRDVRETLSTVRIPFWRHPLSATIDAFLERVDKDHSLEAIGQ